MREIKFKHNKFEQLTNLEREFYFKAWNDFINNKLSIDEFRSLSSSSETEIKEVKKTDI